MATNTRPLDFRDFLPEIYRADEVGGTSFLSTFLGAFESLFEELEGEIEGPPGGGHGGIPDLFDPDATPPPQLSHHPSTSAVDFLTWLAGWIGLPLLPLVLRRPGESDPDYDARRTLRHRQYFKTALQLVGWRSTPSGFEQLLKLSLDDSIDAPHLVITDMSRVHPDDTAVFQLGIRARVGVDTVLGEGPPFVFVVDVAINPNLPELRDPAAVEALRRVALSVLESERPAHTAYQLRIRGPSMQLAPQHGGDVRPGEVYAQLAATAFSWNEPWLANSDT